MIKKQSLDALDYFKILNFIEEFANSQATKDAIRQIYPYSIFEKAETALKEFEEIKEYFDRGGLLSISSFPDIRSLLSRAEKEGVIFESWELKDFLKFLKVSDKVSPFIDELLNFHFLARQIKEILGSYLSMGQPYLLEKLEDTIDEDGNILDTASPMLKYLRKQIKTTEERIKEKLEEILNRKEILPFLQDRFITKRNDRWVIPVRMDSKGQIKGKVQDVSRSGETAFIEPEEIGNLSKKLEELRLEERLEEIRILKDISGEIHQISSSLLREFNLLVYLDKLCSLYKFAQKFNAHVPRLTSESIINLINARHPLLILTKGMVEPLNLRLKDKKILVITGPNAGGKTVTIKTVGLLTAMTNSGIPIPASPSSVIPFVKSIYVDLYHEGSIEERLSSFASHVVTLSEIVQNADSQSLVLLDEIGTNTDPEEGSAFACAILEELRQCGAFTFVTTHLSKVKLFAATEEGMEIASMLFDENTMTPLYRLSIGSLTPSYALEVAKKYGFPEKLINRAYEIKGKEDIKVYELMRELQRARDNYEKKLREIKEIEDRLVRDRERIERQLAEAEERKKTAIEQGKQEAQNMLIKLRKEINLLYEEAKKADRRKLREVSQRVSQISKQFNPEETSEYVNVKAGDFVKIKNLNLLGKVLSIEDGRVKVQTETVQIEAGLREIEKISDFNASRNSKSNFFIAKDMVKEIIDDYSKRLDIRGMRVDEAIPLVERFLNELSINEFPKGLIIHGIGKGILRDMIRDYIKEHPAVQTFRKGNPDEGGDAVTVVELR